MAEEPTAPALPIKNEGESTFNTRVTGWIEVSNENKNVVFGTAMYGNYFGEITKMNLGRQAEEALTQGGWNQLISYILTNFSYTLSLELIANSKTPIPGPGDVITFPLVGVKGIVKPGVTLNSTNNAAQTVTLEAASWDSLDNGGAGTRVAVTPPAPITPQAPASQSAPASYSAYTTTTDGDESNQ